MIRKTALLITGTVAGVVGVVSYNPPHLSSQIASSANTPASDVSPSASATSTKSNSPAQPTSTKSPKSSTKTSSASASPSQTQTPTKSAGVNGVFKGDTSQTRWGPVQVQVTLTDGKITDVTTLQYPNGDRRSQSISSQVIPWLQDEALQVQSAQINGISGATYTSGGFKASLASALQKAGL
jgi:uncharacterized protein with FMN-binding domain